MGRMYHGHEEYGSPAWDKLWSLYFNCCFEKDGVSTSMSTNYKTLQGMTKNILLE